MDDPGFYDLDGTVFWQGPGTLCKRWDAESREWLKVPWLRLYVRRDEAARIDEAEVAERGIPVEVPDTWRDHPKGEGEGGIGQAFWGTIPLGCLASLVVGVIVLVAFVLSGRSWLAAVAGIIAGSLGGTVLGFLLALVPMAIWDLQTRVYLIWRIGWAFFVLALLVDVLCPPVVTVVVAMLLS